MTTLLVSSTTTVKQLLLQRTIDVTAFSGHGAEIAAYEEEDEVDVDQKDAADMMNFILNLVEIFTNSSDENTYSHNNMTEEELLAYQCKSGKFRYNTESLPYIILLVISASFFAGLFWLQRRKYSCLTLVDRRPGLLSPFPITEPCRFRIIYVAFWAMVAYDGILIITQQAEIFIDITCAEKWEKPIIVIINVLIFSVLYFPIIGGISTDTTLGYITATAWIWALAVQRAIKIKDVLMKVDTVDTELSYAAQMALESFSYAIPVISMLILCLALPARLIQGLYLTQTGQRGSQYSPVHPALEFWGTAESKYVTKLFKRPPPPTKMNAVKRIMVKLGIYYQNVPYFRYSHVLLSTIAVSAIFIYYVIFLNAQLLATFATDLIPPLIELVDMQRDVIVGLPFLQKLVMKASKNETDIHEMHKKIDWFIAIGRSHVWCIFYSNVGALITASLIQIYLLLDLMQSYRADRLRAHYGKYEIICPPTTGRGAIGGAVRYMGYQAVMFVWGIVIQILLFTIIGIVVGCAIAIPLWYGYGEYITKFLLTLLPALGVTIGLGIITQLTTAFCFSVKPCGRIVSVKNPRGYSLFAYLSFFKNLFVGIANALRRLIMSVIVGSIVFSRLDLPTLTPRFKRFDAGFKAYEAFINLENAHLNPSVVTFVNVIMDRIQQQARERRALKARLVQKWHKNGGKSAPDEERRFKNEEDEYKHAIIADRNLHCLRFKWQLLRTLACNPILAVERKMILHLDQFQIVMKEEKPPDKKNKTTTKKSPTGKASASTFV